MSWTASEMRYVKSVVRTKEWV